MITLECSENGIGEREGPLSFRKTFFGKLNAAAPRGREGTTVTSPSKCSV